MSVDSKNGGGKAEAAAPPRTNVPTSLPPESGGTVGGVSSSLAAVSLGVSAEVKGGSGAAGEATATQNGDSAGPTNSILPEPMYYRLVGKKKCHAVRVESATFGRAHDRAAENFFEISVDKSISRRHMQISWNSYKAQWELTCLGKNGITMTNISKGSPYMLEKGETKTLVGPTPLRIGTKDIFFWFQPAIKSTETSADSPPKAKGTSEGLEGPGAEQQPGNQPATSNDMEIVPGSEPQPVEPTSAAMDLVN